MLRKTIISLAMILFFVGGGIQLFKMAGSLPKEPKKTSVLQTNLMVRTVIAKQEAFQEKVSGYGVARTLRRTEIRAEISGIVKEISPLLEAGKEVSPEDLLLQLEDSDLQEALKIAQANLEQVKISLTNLDLDAQSLDSEVKISQRDYQTSRRELLRLQDLRDSEDVSQSELDSQILRTSSLERTLVLLRWRKSKKILEKKQTLHQIQIRKSQLVQAQNNLKRATIYPPYKGYIKSRQVHLGAKVSPGEILFSLVDPKKVEIPIALGASHFQEVFPGAVVSLKTQEGGKVVWEGEVNRISSLINSTERTFFVYVEIQETKIVPGTFVIAEVDGKLYSDVIVIPRVAFLNDRVFVVQRKDDGEAIVREQKVIVERYFPDFAIIQSGIEEGTEIVVTGVEEIADGSRVNVLSQR